MEKKFISGKELCEVFKISKTTLYRELKKGLPYVVIAGSNRFEVNEVYDYYKNKMKEVD